MERQLLTLKNVYNTIFAQDYPKYSEDVLKRDAKKGITLISFWRKTLAVEFKNQKYGKLIWRETDKQNRHPSQICNRKCEENLANNYYEEVRDRITEESVLHQIELFETFFVDKKARPDVLFERLALFVDMIYKDDSSFTTDSYTFFKTYLSDSDKFIRYDKRKQICMLSFVITFLTIHAIAGDNMNDARLLEIIKDAGNEYNSFMKSSSLGTSGYGEVSFITTNNTELNTAPLPRSHFFGREREVFDICEFISAGRKIALVGIGGMGKTELMRQVVSQCENEKLVKYIALIQFERNLRNSILGAFTRFSEGNEEEKLDNIFTLLAGCKAGELVVVIDNMNEIPKQSREYERLLELAGAVIVTTRRSHLEGFEKYELSAPSDEAKMLIFRDKYKQVLTAEDYQKLNRLWENKLYDHTLTRGLLGTVAAYHKWSVDDILNNMLESDKDSSDKLKDFYVKTYSLSKFSDNEKRFLELFAEFPYASFKAEYIVRWFAGFISRIDKSTLRELADSGWLNESHGRYSMHPFIAECISKKKNNDRKAFIEHSVDLFNEKFRYKYMFSTVGFISYEPFDEEAFLGETIICLFERCTGELSRAAFEAVYQGVIAYSYGREAVIWKHAERAARMFKGLTAKDELKIRISRYTQYTKIDDVVKEYEYIKNHPDSDSIMLTEAATLIAGVEIVEGNGQAIIDLYKASALDENAPSILLFFSFLLVGAYSAGNLEVLEEAFRIGNRLEPNAPNDAIADFENHKIYYYFAHAQFDKALECLEKGEEIAIRCEMSIQNKIVMMENKATCYRMLGRFLEAEKIMKYCYEEKLKLYGSQSLYIIPTQGEYATALLKVGKYEEAANLYIDLLKGIESRGEVTSQYFVFLNNLGNCYNAWGKPAQAIECLNKALSLDNVAGTLGAGEANYNLAVSYHILGQDIECRKHARISLEIIEPTYGQNNAKVLELKGYIG